jgi:hypothetical protein
MATQPAMFKWRPTEPGLIPCAVRWYLRGALLNAPLMAFIFETVDRGTQKAIDAGNNINQHLDQHLQKPFL